MLDSKTKQRVTRIPQGARAGWRHAGLCAGALASGCLLGEEIPQPSDEPSASIMSMMQALGPSDAPEAGYSCSGLAAGGGLLSGDTTNNLWTSELADGQGLSVEIGSFDQLLAQRYYDRDFIESGRVDQFVVTAQNGESYEFIYWGANECEACPPAPYAPPPNNPWGCGPADPVASPEVR